MDHHTDTQERWSPGPTAMSWLVIVVICGAILILPFLQDEPDPEAAPAEDRVGLILMRLQAQYLVGAAEWVGRDAMFYRQARDQLNRGTVSQRQRFVVVAAELHDPAEARDVLLKLDQQIRREKEKAGDTGTREFSLTEEQRAIQALLHMLYNHEDSDEPRVEALARTDRNLLRDEMGWFGDLALAHWSVATDAERREVLRPANRIVIIFALGVLGFTLGLIAGGIALVIWLVLLANRRIRLCYITGVPHHSVYAETFAIWLAAFVGLQLLPAFVPALEMMGLLYPLLIFFGSLLVLGWPVLRGVSWSQVRRDTGLTWGRTPPLEPLFGGLGYLMALPMLLVGLVLTLILVMIQQFIAAGAEDAFGPTAGPAHPIIEGLADGNWAVRTQLFMLAVVAAPIVEEIMFRGALYRHLRDGSRACGRFGSVIGSGLLNTFIFAAIHPQGLIAVPLLMSLAFMFILLREWRDSVIPAIVMHAISNGIIVSLMILALAG